MISPEILRRYPFFFGLSPAQLQAIAMITDEYSFHQGQVIFEEGQPADKLCLLISGNVDLLMKSEEENEPDTRREFAVGEVNPGDIFGRCTLIEPYIYHATARAFQDGKMLVMDGSQLRTLSQTDPGLAYTITMQIAKSLLEQLYVTRVQLAAAQL